MKYRTRIVLALIPVLSLVLLISCHDRSGKEGKGEVKTPATVSERGGTDIKSMLEYAADNGDRMYDSTMLPYRKLASSVYDSNGYKAIWSSNKHWLPAGDSLLNFIDSSKNYGLFPSDHHYIDPFFIEHIRQEDALAQKK